jgi:thiamine pyrophosphokinase
MRAVIMAGARLETLPAPALLEPVDLLVAADHGADTLLALGLVPHVLIGDMDSVTAETRAALEAKGVETVVLPVAKDETDLEMALRLAADRGAGRIDVFGALGGPRLDHLLGAVFLLGAPWLRGRDVRLRHRLQDLWLVGGDTVVYGHFGDLVSLLPLSPAVDDVWTDGLSYPLRGERLLQAASRGVSNQMSGEQARIRHGAGDLLLVHYYGGRESGSTSAAAGEDSGAGL